MKLSDPGRLTPFQSLMRDWSELAPYNFIHALRLGEPADVERWGHAAAEALQILELRASASIETPPIDIETHLEAELNRSFAREDSPLRFFALATPGGGHWFGAVVDHWLADDFSCRELLHWMYSFYQSPLDSRGRPLLRWTNAFPRKRGRLAAWSSFLKQAVALRRAHRVPLNDPLDFRAGIFRTELPLGALETIRTLAKRQNASVHDVFLAAAAQTFGARARRPGDHRDAVALASAMDLRRFETGEAKSGFGFLINQYTIVERRPEEISLAELIARISAQTRPWKAAPGSDVFAPTRTLFRLSRSRRARATFFQRGAPLVAGLSNVNLTGSWIEQTPIAEYRRVGPTGPLVPIVLMITTLRGRIFIDVTYRRTAFSRPDAECCLANFVAAPCRLVDGAQMLENGYAGAFLHRGHERFFGGEAASG